jgi:hypothetical protein
MPDFLSRLVERTFGLTPVARPVTSSVFAPMPAIESDYIQGLASSNVSPGNMGVNDGDPGTSPQETLNRKKPFNKDDTKSSHQIEDRGDGSDFTSISRPQHNIKPLNQKGSDFPEQVESMHLHQKNGQDYLYSRTPPAKLAQDEEPLYQIDSDTLESVKSEPPDVKNRNDRSALPPKPKLHEEQFRDFEPDSQGHVETEQKDFADVRENRNTFMPVLKSIYDKPQSPETSSLERALSSPVGVQKNRNINRSVITREPELPNENYSKHPRNKNTGDGWQNEPLIYSVDSSVDKTLMGHISDSSLLHESLSSLKNGGPILQGGEPASGADSSQPDYLHPDTPSSIASQRNPKRMNNPKVNATLEQMENMLIDQHAVAPRPPLTVPTVKVTIGRIEVKAVTPPQTSQLQTPSPRQRTVLSLDDYLKQYNG